MSSYTTQLKTLIEQATQYDEGLSIKERIELGRQQLFNDIEYDIFDNRYRRTFETHFIRHFYTREIGFETEGLFKFKLETWLQINMPYFNKLFESELLEYDPLSNIDIHSDQDRTRESDGKNTQSSTQDTTGSNTTESDTVEARTQDTTGLSTTESSTVDSSEATSNATSNTDSDSTQNTIAETESSQDNLRIHSDNPDSRLALTTSGGVIEYASELTENKTSDTGTTSSNTTSNTDSTTTSQDSTSADTTSNTDSTTTSLDNTSADATTNTITTGNTTQGIIGSVTGENTGSEKEQMKNVRKGKDGTVTYQQMVKELRQTFIRIEKDIFDEMNKELFMLVY